MQYCFHDIAHVFKCRIWASFVSKILIFHSPIKNGGQILSKRSGMSWCLTWKYGLHHGCHCSLGRRMRGTFSNLTSASKGVFQVKRCFHYPPHPNATNSGRAVIMGSDQKLSSLAVERPLVWDFRKRRARWPGTLRENILWPQGKSLLSLLKEKSGPGCVSEEAGLTELEVPPLDSPRLTWLLYT